MSTNRCTQARCGTEYTWRPYPRFIRSKRDKMWAQDNNARRVDTVELGCKARLVTWVEKLFCDCGWRLNLKGVDVQLLELLLPDYHAQGEIRRRAA